MTSVRHISLVLSAAAVLTSACESAPALTPSANMDGSVLTDRSSDGLLHNPALQEVVDAQNARAADRIASFMTHADPLVRARAAFAAASIQSPTLVPHLLELLEDRDPRVRADAAFALGQTGDSNVVLDLSTALRNETEVTAQSRLIEAMGRVGTVETLGDFSSLDPSRAAASHVALAIARMGARAVHDDAGVEWVAKRLTAGDADLRRNAAYFFARVPSSHPWALHAAYVRDALEDYPLDEPAAMHLVVGLGKFHGADGRLLLHRLANATDWRVRANTAKALAPMSSDTRILDGLMNALDDPSHHVAANAAASLDWSELMDEERLSQIERWVEQNRDDLTTTGALLGVLANRDRGGVVLEYVADLETSDPSALPAVIPALGLVQDEQAFSSLQEYTTSEDRQIRGAAVTALSNRWARWRGAIDGNADFFEVFSNVLETADNENALAAASVLTDPVFLSEGSSEPLLATYQRLVEEHAPPAIIAQYLRILGMTGDGSVVSILESETDATHPVVRNTAIETLAHITGTTPSGNGTDVYPASAVDWEALKTWGPFPRVRLETTQGDIIVELAADQAPRTVQQFLELVTEGTYDDSPFHRVLPNFAVQSGTSPDDQSNADQALVSEFTRIPFARGVLGMANSGKDTERSEFFITHSMQPHLDGRYTAFGQVVYGMEAVDRMTAQDRVISATIIEEDLSS